MGPSCTVQHGGKLQERPAHLPKIWQQLPRHKWQGYSPYSPPSSSLSPFLILISHPLSTVILLTVLSKSKLWRVDNQHMASICRNTNSCLPFLGRSTALPAGHGLHGRSSRALLLVFNHNGVQGLTWIWW